MYICIQKFLNTHMQFKEYYTYLYLTRRVKNRLVPYYQY